MTDLQKQVKELQEAHDTIFIVAKENDEITVSLKGNQVELSKIAYQAMSEDKNLFGILSSAVLLCAKEDKMKGQFIKDMVEKKL